MKEKSARGRFRRQMVWLTTAAVAVAAILLILLTQALQAGYTWRAVDQTLQHRADAVVVEITTDGMGDVAERLGPGTVVYRDDGRLLAGTPPRALASTYADLAVTGSEQTRTPNGTSRVLARPYSTAEARGVVVTSEPLAPYERTAAFTLTVSLGAALLMVLLAFGLTSWVSRRALAPVGEMSRTAREWSRHDLARRFDLGPATNEITALGSTLDLLLDRVASAIRSEERLTAELAHELRTPLTAIRGSAELALLSGDLGPRSRTEVEAIEAAAGRMAEIITGLLELARSTTGEGGACRAADAVRRLAASHPAVLDDVPDDLWVSLPEGLVVRCLSPVVENAVRYADRVQVSARLAGDQVVLEVVDDGSGVAPGMRDRLFEPGATTSERSAGLGLALSRRIARNAGGDVTLRPGAGPTCFAVTLPGHRG